MFHFKTTCYAATILLIATLSTGCVPTPADNPPATDESSNASDAPATIDGNQGSEPASDTTGSEENAEVAAALAQLQPEDRTAAEKQKTCPVSGQLLGSMGVPIKVDVNGRSVFICCEGCRAALLDDPEE